MQIVEMKDRNTKALIARLKIDEKSLEKGPAFHRNGFGIQAVCEM